MKAMKASFILATAALLLVAAPSPAADLDWHGFVEGAYGARSAEDPAFDDVQDYTLAETRAQLHMSAWGEAGEAFYVIARGRARVVMTAEDGAEILLGSLEEGDFFGGWITSRIVGPLKGEPGTTGW